MTDTELFPFMDLFRSVARIFPIRGAEHEVRDMGASYFKTLRRYTLQQVQVGAEGCLQRCKHFPKPAEWIDLIPRHTAQAAEVPMMTEAQAHAYVRAESLRYEDAPCGCAECLEANVNWKPLRFVPETDGEHDRMVRDPLRDRTVTAGHWAHGFELQRYYQAKGAFYAKCDALGFRPPMGDEPHKGRRRKAKGLTLVTAP